jgi:uncharacterized protein YoxC
MRFSRRTVGRVMLGVGIVNVVLALVGIIVGRQLVSELTQGVDDSLELTTEALDSTSDTIDVARAVVGTVDEGLGTVGDVVAEVGGSLETTESALARASDLTSEDVPEALDAVTGALPTLVGVAGAVDNALRLLSQAPFGPDYDPAVPFDDALRPVAETLAPLPDQLRGFSAELAALAESSGVIAADIERLSGELDDVDAQLAEASALLDRYAATADEASTLAARTRNDLDDQSDAARLLITLLGVAFAAGQVVPLWLGRELLANPEPLPPPTGSPVGGVVPGERVEEVELVE